VITSTVKGKLLAFAIFSLGIATGGVGSYVYETRVHTTAPDTADSGKRRMNAQRDVFNFYDYLGLNSDQRSQVSKILEETRGEYQKLAAQTRPQSTKLREESQNRIRELLTPEQKKKYDEWRSKQSRFRGQPPSPGPSGSK
jgi:Spy/CpxP family protein refolding chaperone